MAEDRARVHGLLMKQRNSTPDGSGLAGEAADTGSAVPTAQSKPHENPQSAPRQQDDTSKMGVTSSTKQPNADVGYCEAEVIVTTPRGDRIELTVWEDKYSRSHAQVYRIGYDGEECDLLDNAYETGRAVERNQNVLIAPRQQDDTSSYEDTAVHERLHGEFMAELAKRLKAGQLVDAGMKNKGPVRHEDIANPDGTYQPTAPGTCIEYPGSVQPYWDGNGEARWRPTPRRLSLAARVRRLFRGR